MSAFARCAPGAAARSSRHGTGTIFGSSAPPPRRASRSAYTPAQNTTLRALTSPAGHESRTPLPARARDPGDLVPEQDLAAGGHDIVGEAARDEAIVDDPRSRHVQRAHAGRMRLELAQALRADQLEPRRRRSRPRGGATPRGAAAPKRRSRRSPCRRCWYGIDRSAQYCLQRRRALRAETSLQRARRVVDARVDHAAVAPGLVLRDRRFLVENDDSQPGPPERKRARDSEADDTRADDGDVGACDHPTDARRDRRLHV